MLFFKKKRICSELTDLFINHAKSFEGLYNSIDRILHGENKKNTKALEEFYKRISFLEGYEKLAYELNKSFPSSDMKPKQIEALGEIMSKAMADSGIHHGLRNEVIVLSWQNVLHYQEWDGKEIYPDSKVKIVFPAWYQNGNLIEKGFCSAEE